MKKGAKRRGEWNDFRQLTVGRWAHLCSEWDSPKLTPKLACQKQESHSRGNTEATGPPVGVQASSHSTSGRAWEANPLPSAGPPLSYPCLEPSFWNLPVGCLGWVSRVPPGGLAVFPNFALSSVKNQSHRRENQTKHNLPGKCNHLLLDFVFSDSRCSLLSF